MWINARLIANNNNYHLLLIIFDWSAALHHRGGHGHECHKKGGGGGTKTGVELVTASNGTNSWRSYFRYNCARINYFHRDGV